VSFSLFVELPYYCIIYQFYHKWKTTARRGSITNARVEAELQLSLSHSLHVLAVSAAAKHGPQPFKGTTYVSFASLSGWLHFLVSAAQSATLALAFHAFAVAS